MAWPNKFENLKAYKKKDLNEVLMLVALYLTRW